MADADGRGSAGRKTRLRPTRRVGACVRGEDKCCVPRWREGGRLTAGRLTPGDAARVPESAGGGASRRAIACLTHRVMCGAGWMDRWRSAKAQQDVQGRRPRPEEANHREVSSQSGRASRRARTPVPLPRRAIEPPAREPPPVGERWGRFQGEGLAAPRECEIRTDEPTPRPSALSAEPDSPPTCGGRFFPFSKCRAKCCAKCQRGPWHMCQLRPRADCCLGRAMCQPKCRAMCPGAACRPKIWRSGIVHRVRSGTRFRPRLSAALDTPAGRLPDPGERDGGRGPERRGSRPA